MLRRDLTAPWIKAAIADVMERWLIMSCMVNVRTLNLRMERMGPSSANGAITALTREPSGNRASTMGLDSSTRRPTWETIRSMMCSRCGSSLKTVCVRSNLPNRST
ncbi:MAG: hypothetical protein BWY83_02861 [bacterium ADurb.Bin478]|nr:MAG: hypothetical protein BWY83_02861 [bacterium ADurb.Bin478]